MHMVVILFGVGERSLFIYIWSYVIPCCVVRPITYTTVGGGEGGEYIYDCVYVSMLIINLCSWTYYIQACLQ